MKKGKDCLVSKFVYRLVDGVYLRDASFNYIWLTSEFPYIDKVACSCDSFKLRMILGLCVEITAWKDKHNNVIVRVIDKSIV